MKIKIVESGWTNYTGYLGPIEFIDSVSVQDVGQADAAYLAGIVSVEEVGTGRNPSSAQSILDHKDTEVPVEKPVEQAPAPVVPLLTKEELEAIADKSGIKGIREVAEPLGLKGNSIAELIERILVVQGDGRALAKD